MGGWRGQDVIPQVPPSLEYLVLDIVGGLAAECQISAGTTRLRSHFNNNVDVGHYS